MSKLIFKKLCTPAHSGLYPYMNLPPEITGGDKTGDLTRPEGNPKSSCCRTTDKKRLYRIIEWQYGWEVKMTEHNERINAERVRQRRKNDTRLIT